MAFGSVLRNGQTAISLAPTPAATQIEMQRLTALVQSGEKVIIIGATEIGRAVSNDACSYWIMFVVDI